MSKEELNLIKEEIYQKMRELDKKMTDDFNSQKNELKKNYQKFNEKITYILNNNREIIESVVAEKINYEKIQALENFKNKADGILISHEIRINNNNKDINNMKTKYDKAIVDNLSVPGFIGINCQYKNIGEYILSNRNEFARFKYEKDNLKQESKEIKGKIDSMFKQIISLVDNSIERCKEYTNDKILEYNKRFDAKFEEFGERAMALRLEMRDAQAEIEKKVTNLRIETQKLKDMKEKFNTLDIDIGNINKKIEIINYDKNHLFDINANLNKFLEKIKKDVDKLKKIIVENKTKNKDKDKDKERDRDKDKDKDKDKNKNKKQKRSKEKNYDSNSVRENDKNDKFNMSQKKGNPEKMGLSLFSHEDNHKLSSSIENSPNKTINVNRSKIKTYEKEFFEKKHFALEEEPKKINFNKIEKNNFNIFNNNDNDNDNNKKDLKDINEEKEERKNDYEISNNNDIYINHSSDETNKNDNYENTARGNNQISFNISSGNQNNIEYNSKNKEILYKIENGTKINMENENKNDIIKKKENLESINGSVFNNFSNKHKNELDNFNNQKIKYEKEIINNHLSNNNENKNENMHIRDRDKKIILNDYNLNLVKINDSDNNSNNNKIPIEMQKINDIEFGVRRKVLRKATYNQAKIETNIFPLINLSKNKNKNNILDDNNAISLYGKFKENHINKYNDYNYHGLNRNNNILINNNNLTYNSQFDYTFNGNKNNNKNETHNGNSNNTNSNNNNNNKNNNINNNTKNYNLTNNNNLNNNIKNNNINLNYNDDNNENKSQNNRSIRDSKNNSTNNLNSNTTSNIDNSNISSNKTSKRNSFSRNNSEKSNININNNLFNKDNKNKNSNSNKLYKSHISKSTKKKNDMIHRNSNSSDSNSNIYQNIPPQINQNPLRPTISPHLPNLGVNYVGLHIDKIQEEDDYDDIRMSFPGNKLNNLRLEGIGISSPNSQKITKKKIKLQGISTEAPLKISAAFGRTAYTFIDKNNEKNKNKLYSIKMVKQKKNVGNDNLDLFFAPNNK